MRAGELKDKQSFSFLQATWKNDDSEQGIQCAGNMIVLNEQ